LQIPDPTSDTWVIRPAVKTFINGMAESYSFNYDKALLSPHLTRKEFDGIVRRINSALYSEFPCVGCQCFGYCCCLCTLGLSFCLPLRKVAAARRNCEKEVAKLN